MSEHTAAKIYKVCRATMRNRMKDPAPNRVGAPRKFPDYEEERIAEFLLACSETGIPLNRYHCFQLFSHVAVELGKREKTRNQLQQNSVF